MKKGENRMYKRSITICMGIIAGLFGTSTLIAGEVGGPDHVAKLLSDTKMMAYQLKEDAATMETFTRVDVSREGHAFEITAIKDHINALEKQVTKLKEARAEASPWQKTVIDRITPYLGEMQGYTYAVMEHLNGTKKHTITEYKDYLEANADYSADLAAMVGDFIDYGKAKERMQSLAEKLEIDTGK